MIISFFTRYDQWKLYMNMSADIPTKPLPWHLAVLYDHAEFCHELTQMSLSEMYSGAFAVSTKNGSNQDVFQLAIAKQKYKIMKALFDERIYLVHVINRMINLCLLTKVEYDATAATKSKNFLFFKVKYLFGVLCSWMTV